MVIYILGIFYYFILVLQNKYVFSNISLYIQNLLDFITMFFIQINNKKYKVNKLGNTLLQYCNKIGFNIPRFCYHEKLSIAGNCRMCLIEIGGSRKPTIACSTSLVSGMKYYTNNRTVKKIRESVLEFLLINHPLDCPICDQGGECDLQDQTMIFGSDRGRFSDIKRSVEDKYFGPFIKSIMSRCIHCTRCIRYLDEIVGLNIIGTMGRGKNTEISSYVSTPILNELSGNVIDLCPVGALTSKPYAFTTRPWELSSYESIDILDSINSNIRTDTKGNIIMRILPKINKYLNEEWITDFIRFSYDSIRNERLTFPLLKSIRNNNIIFEYTSWEIIFTKFKYLLFSNNLNCIHIFIGDTINLYSSFLLKYWIETTYNLIFTYFENYIDNNEQSNFLLNKNINTICRSSNFFIIQLDLKKNLSILNVKLKKLKWKYQNKINIYYIGCHTLLNYKYKHIGISNIVLLLISKGKHFLCNTLIKLNFNLLKNANVNLNLKYFNKYSFLDIHNITLKSEIIHYNYLGLNNSNILRNKYYHNSLDYIDIYYLINYNKSINNYKYNSYNYIIFQGIHGSFSTMNSNMILPSLSYAEEEGLFMNLEGIVQTNKKILYGPGIALSLSSFLDKIISKPYFLNKLNIEYFNDLFNNSVNFLNKSNFIEYDHYNVNYNKDRYNLFFNNNYYNTKVYLNSIISKSVNNFYFKKLFIKDYYK